jgi:hypothetical protein
LVGGILTVEAVFRRLFATARPGQPARHPAIIGLDHKDAKGQPPNDFVHEADRRSLITGIVDLEYADARAIIDGGELIEPLLRACDPL